MGNFISKTSGHPVSHFDAEFQMSPKKNFASVTKNEHVETIFQESSNVFGDFLSTISMHLPIFSLIRKSRGFRVRSHGRLKHIKPARFDWNMKTFLVTQTRAAFSKFALV